MKPAHGLALGCTEYPNWIGHYLSTTTVGNLILETTGGLEIALQHGTHARRSIQICHQR